MSTWTDVVVDSYIRDANEVVWRVCALDMTEAGPDTTPAFRCRNAAGDWASLAPKPRGARVDIVWQPDAAEQVALLRDVVGARQVARKNHTASEWGCEPWPPKAGAALDVYRFHMEAMHGMWVGDVKTYAKLLEVHAEAHDPDETRVGKHIPHHH